MVISAIINVPLHVTSMWVPHYVQDPSLTGSMGAGIVIRPGVTVMVRHGRPRNVTLRHLNELMRIYGGDFEVTYRSPVDLGLGYGLSGAITLGASMGMAAMLGKPMLHAARIAHEVEVSLSTGLGDVIAEYYGGGVELRVKPGAPGYGLVDRIPYPHDLVVMIHEFSREDTGEMLRRLHDRLVTVGRKYVLRLIEEPTYDNFITLSPLFSREIGFLRYDMEARLKRCIKYIESYYAKKGLLVVLVHGDELTQAKDCLETMGMAMRVFRISNSGAEIKTRRETKTK